MAAKRHRSTNPAAEPLRGRSSGLVDGRRFPSFEHAKQEVLHWIGFYNGERLHEDQDGSLPMAENRSSATSPLSESSTAAWKACLWMSIAA
jgi:hypothetical protein